MANAKQEVEPCYDSDSGDSWSPLDLLRIEATDDDDIDSKEEKRALRTGRSSRFGFDDELHGAGGAPEEDDEDKEALGVEEEEDESSGEEAVEELEDEFEEVEPLEAAEVGRQRYAEEEEKEKDKEAVTIPRTGAFYMHDDRCQGSGRGRRMNLGSKNLQELKDEKKWPHGKFQEMMRKDPENKKFNAYTKVQNFSDSHHQGYYKNKSRGCDVNANQFIPDDNNNYQGLSSRIVRGRGPMKYKPLNSSNDVDRPGNMELRKSPGIKSKADSARTLSDTSQADSDSLASKKKHHHATSSKPDISVANKRNVQPRFLGYDACMPHYKEYMQGNSVDDYFERNRLSAQESIFPVVEHRYTGLPLQPSVTTYPDSSQLRSQARDCPLHPLMIHHSPTSSNAVDNHVVQQTPLGSRCCCPLQAYTQQLTSHSAMQFGDQHLGHLSDHVDDRAVGRSMIQPQAGLGNSEMTRMNLGRKNFRDLKDEKKWPHDKFEEMMRKDSENKKFNAYAKVQNFSDSHHQGYYNNKSRGRDVKANRFIPNDNNNNQGPSSRIVRGGGHVKYKPLNSSNDVDPPGNMELRKSPGIKSNADSARTWSDTSQADSDSLASKKKHYHATSSKPDISVANKRNVQPSLPGYDACIPHYKAYMQGNNVDDYFERNRLSAQESIFPVVEHHHTVLPLQSSVTTYPDSSQLRSQARDCPLHPLMIHHSPTSSNAADRHNHVVQQTPLGSRCCCPLQAYTQQLTSHSAMQFGNQHLGHLSDHVDDRAVTRYMIQPQVGLGNSEMTRAGASASRLSQGNKSQDETEVLDDTDGSQKMKPQRYSKMNFKK
ncbi:uncharacterized protein LOC105639457 [Jatropha curcas]|uniref:uncharacterized protein LOC105639457 n=1 Tax=Jatropha curcas TaxID=180498 RepID=UPI001895F5DC|nr:uncharacterized protein LOC105639457 [Jatropha curcas]